MTAQPSHPIWGLEVQTEGLRAVVLLNGYPVFMPTDTGGRTTSLKLNPHIVEGDNEIAVRLGRELDGADLGPRADFSMKAYHTVKGVAPTEEDYVARYEWDPDAQELEPDGMTDAFRQRFAVPPKRAFGRWAWQDAIPFVAGDRVAVEHLVGKCRRALEERDVDTLLALLSLYAAETSIALNVPIPEAEQLLREYLEPYFGDDRFEMAPLDYGSMPLIPVCDGRIVLVMAPGGGPILQGQIRVDEGEEPPLPPVGMELAVSNLGGTWTVVR